MRFESLQFHFSLFFISLFSPSSLPSSSSINQISPENLLKLTPYNLQQRRRPYHLCRSQERERRRRDRRIDSKRLEEHGCVPRGETRERYSCLIISIYSQTISSPRTVPPDFAAHCLNNEHNIHLFAPPFNDPKKLL